MITTMYVHNSPKGGVDTVVVAILVKPVARNLPDTEVDWKN